MKFAFILDLILQTRIDLWATEREIHTNEE